MAFWLVTGGAGFIGSNIVEELLNRREKVRILDNFSSGKRENIDIVINKLTESNLPISGNLEVIEGDIRSYHIVRQAVQKVDFILHQAALPSVPRSIADPITTNEVNVVGTLNILEAAKETGVKKIVYASSSSVYGSGKELPKHENMCPEPCSPYAASKLAGEKYCKIFSAIYGLQSVILRYFNVFGPRQDPTSQYSAVIPKFIELMKKDKELTVYGDGTQSRDFTYVSNVVEANLLAAEKESVSGEVFNVACEENKSLNTLIEILGRLLEVTPKITYAKPRLGEIKHSFASIDKAKSVLGYKPKICIEEGLKNTVGIKK